jgi:hypothetical protein
MKISSTSLLGEKSRGLLQDLAFLPENLILLAQPRKLLGDIPMSPTATRQPLTIAWNARLGSAHIAHAT